MLAKDQPVLELETDKATIEVPSSVAGQVKEIKVKAGDKVKVGQAILSVDGDAASGRAGRQPPPARREGRRRQPKARPNPRPRHASRGASAAPRRRHATGRAPSAARSSTSTAGRAPAAEPATSDMPVAPAAPSVRRMARELGVDINQVAGSGPDGRISVDDVKAHAKRIDRRRRAGGGGAAALPPSRCPISRAGAQIERQPMRAVRRKTAEHLSAAWATIPHVTQHDFADITGSRNCARDTRSRSKRPAATLTVTAIAVKIVAAALQGVPAVQLVDRSRGRRDRLQEIREHRRRRRYRPRPARAGHPRRRHQEHHRRSRWS